MSALIEEVIEKIFAEALEGRADREPTRSLRGILAHWPNHYLELWSVITLARADDVIPLILYAHIYGMI